MGAFLEQESPFFGLTDRIKAAALVLMLLLGATTVVQVVAAEPAHAVGCWGDYCSGEDPMSTGCGDDAVTLSAVDLVGARLELRWSATCKTNWARWQQYPRGWSMSDIPLTVYAEQDTGYTQVLDFGLEGAEEGTYWSPMIYSPVHMVRAGATLWCGDRGLLASAFDCATEGKETTGWG